MRVTYISCTVALKTIDAAEVYLQLIACVGDETSSAAHIAASAPVATQDARLHAARDVQGEGGVVEGGAAIEVVNKRAVRGI